MADNASLRFDKPVYDIDLFKNMASFTDAVWKLDPHNETVFVMQDKIDPELEGRIVTFSELQTQFLKRNHESYRTAMGARLDPDFIKNLQDTVTTETQILVDDKYHHVLCTFSPIRSQDGKTSGAYYSFRDLQQTVDEKEMLERHISEVQRRAEEEAELSSKYLKLVTELTESGFWYFDLNEYLQITKISVSESLRLMLGYKSSRDFPNTFDALMNLIHPDERDEIYDTVLKTVHGQGSSDIKFRGMKKNGSYQFFRLHAKLGRFGNNNSTMLFGTLSNIDYEEKELRDLTDQISVLLDSILGGIQIVKNDEAFSIVKTTDELAAVLGYTPDELLEKFHFSALEMIAPIDRERVTYQVTTQLKSNGRYAVKYRIRHRNGGVRWVLDTGKIIESSDGSESDILYSLIQDITEQENNNVKLIKERAMYRDVLTHDSLFLFTVDITDGFFREEFYDAEGKGMIATQGLSLPISYDEECRVFMENCQVQFSNEHSKKIFTREGILSLYDEGIRTTTADYYEKVSDRYMRALLLLSKDENSHIQCISYTFDVTETVKKEMEQKRALEDALAMAENANRAKTAFLNNVSHDIRTPMNGIIGFTALASAHIDDRDKVMDCLKKIQISSNHLLSLINDVLDMSRIESGKVKIEEKEVSLANVIHDLKNIVQPESKSKQIDLYFDTVDVKDETVWCDKLRLSQILLNCMSNAIKFTPTHGTVGIKIIQLPCDKENYATYQFKIRDTGIGMTDEFQQKLFEPFERENTATVSGTQGTGLGMAISKNIVEMMGGTIEVESQKGVGTEFTITLCFKKAGSPVVEHEIPDLKGVHALVCDDSYDTCTSVSDMLTEIGLRPEWTMSGKEAVLRTQDAVRKGDPFGVYIIDWLIPDMNGIEAVRRIRREIGNNTPIIILTAYDWSDIEDEAREAGVTAFCAKPLFMSELYSLLVRASSGEPCIQNRNLQTIGSFETQVKVLLVEDNMMNREIACEILMEAGAEVKTAVNGKEAVDFIMTAEEGGIDVILMDVQMPVMDGYEATRMIRAMDGWRSKLPVIAMTANAFDEDRKTANEAGMDAHIAKPLDADLFFATIKNVLRSK